MIKSSAYWMTLVLPPWLTLCNSLVYMLNSVGDSTSPCGRPCDTTLVTFCFPTLISIILFVRRLNIQFTKTSGTIYACSILVSFTIFTQL
uniref:Uncharacterized protein n=1 Tax=Anopheles darlingi TaxID=43151 RepID=A0A2M4D3Z9_ANODA